MEEISVRTERRIEIVDITSKVNSAISKLNVKEGVVLVYCPHTTAGITINENADPNVVVDIINKLNEMIPANAGYLHAEGNSDAHIKSSLMGVSQSIPVSGGRMKLGTWQSVFFCEFDGPRSRRVIITAK